ncbi:hypothetical protein GOODEAATRI_018155, partial [Goodea atripinnis]
LQTSKLHVAIELAPERHVESSMARVSMAEQLHQTSHHQVQCKVLDAVIVKHPTTGLFSSGDVFSGVSGDPLDWTGFSSFQENAPRLTAVSQNGLVHTVELFLGVVLSP